MKKLTAQHQISRIFHAIYAHKWISLGSFSAFLLVVFLIQTYVFPIFQYRMNLPQVVSAREMDYGLIEKMVESGTSLAIDDTDKTRIELHLKDHTLEISKDLSSLSLSGKTLRILGEDNLPLSGMKYVPYSGTGDYNQVVFAGANDEKITFVYYEDSFLIRTENVSIHAMELQDVSIDTKEGRFFVGDAIETTTDSGATTEKHFAPYFEFARADVDGKRATIKTDRDGELANVFREIREKQDSSYSFDLLDDKYQIGKTSFVIPGGEKQEIKIVYDFGRSVGSESYLSADTFQGDPYAVEEVMKMGGLPFVKNDSFFYADTPKIGYLDMESKKFIEIKLKNDDAEYVGKRGDNVIYQGKEDTYVYTLKSNGIEKVKETVLIKTSRSVNHYEYEIIGNYRLEKNEDGSIKILTQNLNKSGLTETCSDDYYDKERQTRLDDLEKHDSKFLEKKYGLTDEKKLDTVDFCVSPAILKEKKKSLPYDVPVFSLAKPVILDVEDTILETPITVNIVPDTNIVSYDFDTTSVPSSAFPIQFDPTLTTDADLKKADLTNFTVPGGVGLGTQLGANGSVEAWANSTSMLTTRQMHGVVTYNGYIYAIGGYDGSISYLATTEYASINPNGTLGTWTGSTTMNSMRGYLGVATYNGYIYAIGGYNDSLGLLATTEYAPINANGTLGAWTVTSSMITARYLNGSSVYNGYIYTIGGYDNTVSLASTEYAPINANGTLGAWTNTTIMGTSRAGHGVAVYNGYIYAIGGFTGLSVVTTTEYAPINANGTLGSWTATTSMVAVVGRYSHGVAVYNGYIYAIGGYDGSTALVTTEYAPINANGTLGAWTSTTSMNTQRGECGVVIYNGYIYAIGGYSTVTLATTEYTYIGSKGKLGIWAGSTTMTSARAYVGTTTYNGYVYAIGGMASSITYRATTEYAPINADGSLGAWTATTSLPATRARLGVVAYNGYIYALGGYNGISYFTTTYYAPLNVNGTIGAWTTTTVLPTTRSEFGSAVYNGYIYIIGGKNAGYFATTYFAPLNANGTIGAWTATSSLGVARSALGSAVYNGYIYALGGMNGSYLATTEYAQISATGSLSAWTATTSMNVIRSRLASAVYNGYIYAIGGTTNGTNYLASTEYATLNTNGTIGTWSNTTNLVTPRGTHGLQVYNGYIYLIGGINGGTYYNTTMYASIGDSGSPMLNTWTASTDVWTPMSDAGVVAYNGYIYAIGGSYGGNLNSVRYAPISSTGSIGVWTATSSLGTARSLHAVAVYNGYIYAIGGWNGTSTEYATTEYAAINTTGTLGSWSASTTLNTARAGLGVAIYNGYIYAVGGEIVGNTTYSTTEYATIGVNGIVGSWTMTTSMGTTRHSLGVVTYNGYIYAIGGRDGGGIYATTEYAPINANGTLGSWTPTAVMGIARYDHGTVIYNGYIYALGGTNFTTYYSQTEYAPINTDGTLGVWKATTSMGVERSNQGYAVYNGYIYVIGGINSGGYLSSTEYTFINQRYPVIGTWAPSTNMGTARYYHGNVALNGYLYAIGGTINGSTSLATTEFAPINSTGSLGAWTSTTSMGVPRYSHGVAVYNGYIYAIGGYSGGTLATTEFAPINSTGSLGAWTSTTSMGVPRYSHGVAVYNGYIYAIGGYSGGTLATTEFAPINTNGSLGAWTSTTSMGVARYSHGVAFYNGYIYALGGRNGITYLNSTEYAPINSNGTIGAWTSTTSMGIARISPGVVAYNGYIYVIGGWSSAPFPLATTAYTSISSTGSLGVWTDLTSMGTRRSYNGVVAYNGNIYAIGGAGMNSTEFTRIENKNLQSWHIRYDKGSASNTGIYFSTQQANMIDSDTLIRYTLWNNTGTTVLYKSSWIPLDTYMAGGTEIQNPLPTFNKNFRYVEFEIMRPTGSYKSTNNITSIAYGDLIPAMCLVCSGSNVTINSACIITITMTCAVNDIEILTGGTLEIQSPANLDFDFTGHKIWVRDGGKILVRSGSKLF